MEENASKSTLVPKFIIATLLLNVVFTTPVLATGSGHHHHNDDKSGHMQTMMAVKEDIPDEYQIMERTPIHPSEESLQQGRRLFLENCSACHGEEGNGKGPAAASSKTPPANFLDQKHSAMYGPGEKFWIISYGAEKTGMPAFSHLAPLDRWHLVNHILQLQQATEEYKDHVHK